MSAPRTRHKIAARIGGAAERAARRRTLLGLLVLTVAAFLAYVAFISTTGPPFQSRYQVKVSVPANAPALREGQAVRVGGRLAGLIAGVDPDRERGGTIVTANITKPEFRPLPADTEAYVRVHSIVYETYLELRPGDADEELESGDELAGRATSGVDLVEAVQLFDERTRAALSDAATSLGAGVAGRGAGLNAAFANLRELAADLGPQLRAARVEPGTLGALVRGAAGTARGLRGERADDVTALIEGGAAALGATGANDAALREALRELPGFELQLLSAADLAEPVLAEAALLAGELRPVAADLAARLPALNRVLALGDEMRSGIEDVADAADPVIVAGRPVAWGLFPTMTTLGPINRDLRVLLAGTRPYKPEIAQAGRWLADATSHDSPGGLASGAPAARFLPVLGTFPCQNPIPAPGEAQGDHCDH
ncbi:MAG TPA: MlaD family protein [Solirubrobacterales bacterium]